MIADDPTAATWHALRRSAADAGCKPRLVADRATAWWSATFSGYHLSLTLRAPTGAALDRWLAALPDTDLPVVGHLVADVAVDRVVAGEDHACIELSLLVLDG